jgi:hypothetical protein
MDLDLAAVVGGMPSHRVVETTYYRSSRSHGSSHQPRHEAPRREPRAPQPEYYVASGTAPRGLSNHPADARAAEWAISQAR